jgi:hypothetical protein
MALPIAPQLLLEQSYMKRALLPPVGDAVVAQGGHPPGLLLHWDHVHEDGVHDDALSPGQLSAVLASPGATRYSRGTIGGHRHAAPRRLFAHRRRTSRRCVEEESITGCPGSSS